MGKNNLELYSGLSITKHLIAIYAASLFLTVILLTVAGVGSSIVDNEYFTNLIMDSLRGFLILPNFDSVLTIITFSLSTLLFSKILKINLTTKDFFSLSVLSRFLFLAAYFFSIITVLGSIGVVSYFASLIEFLLGIFFLFVTLYFVFNFDCKQVCSLLPKAVFSFITCIIIIALASWTYSYFTQYYEAPPILSVITIQLIYFFLYKWEFLFFFLAILFFINKRECLPQIYRYGAILLGLLIIELVLAYPHINIVMVLLYGILSLFLYIFSNPRYKSKLWL
ncbi:hypothetical protein JXB01_00570 [Candidatus Micrarchaeota archaeon]|nr:hypothetical protein [Candidatus Micrarchaeota archaeon]